MSLIPLAERINIARVLYRDPDIAFFDDVLSALVRSSLWRSFPHRT